MKITILILALLFSVNSFSQNSDSIKVAAIEKKFESFKPIVKDYLNHFDNSSNLDSIKKFAKALEEESNEFILEIKTIFEINEDYIVGYSTDMALSFIMPNLASFYQTSAASKMSINQNPPNYLENLLNINEIAKQISNLKKIERLKKYRNQMLIGYQELIAFNS